MFDIRKLLPTIQTNVLLAPHTSFRIGGPADYFYEAKTKDDLIRAVSISEKINLPYFILGGGTNILVSDKGFRGIVIKLIAKSYKLKANNIYTEAGVPMGILVAEAAKSGLSGLEWAAGLPGTVGGAIRGNAGSFGHSMADIVKSVEVLDGSGLKSEITPKNPPKFLRNLGGLTGQAPYNNKLYTGQANLQPMIRIFKNRDCKFGYRESIFKRNPNLIILSAELRLKKGDKVKIQEKIKENLKHRKENHPPYFSCGCIFKNIKLANIHKSGHKFHEYKSKEFVKIRGRLVPICEGRIPTGYLIDDLGLKGLKIGGAMISYEHGNFIINTGKAKAEDVITLIGIIKERIQNKFGILLEEEIQYVGFE